MVSLISKIVTWRERASIQLSSDTKTVMIGQFYIEILKIETAYRTTFIADEHSYVYGDDMLLPWINLYFGYEKLWNLLKSYFLTCNQANIELLKWIASIEQSNNLRNTVCLSILVPPEYRMNDLGKSFPYPWFMILISDGKLKTSSFSNWVETVKKNWDIHAIYPILVDQPFLNIHMLCGQTRL